MDTLYKYEGKLENDSDRTYSIKGRRIRYEKGEYRVDVTDDDTKHTVRVKLESIDHLVRLLTEARITLSRARNKEGVFLTHRIEVVRELVHDRMAELRQLMSEGNTAGDAIDILLGQIDDLDAPDDEEG